MSSTSPRTYQEAVPVDAKVFDAFISNMAKATRHYRLAEGIDRYFGEDRWPEAKLARPLYTDPTAHATFRQLARDVQMYMSAALVAHAQKTPAKDLQRAVFAAIDKTTEALNALIIYTEKATKARTNGAYGWERFE